MARQQRPAQVVVVQGSAARLYVHGPYSPRVAAEQADRLRTRLAGEGPWQVRVVDVDRGPVRVLDYPRG